MIDDDMIVEKRMILEVDGSREAVVIFTPGEEDLWALGNLYCRRMIESIKDIRSIKEDGGRIIVERSNKERAGSWNPGFFTRLREPFYRNKEKIMPPLFSLSNGRSPLMR